MAWKIYRRKRYFYAEEVGGTNLRHRYHSKEVRIDRKYNNSTDFTFYMNHSGLVLTKMDKVPFADILDATGTPFASIMALEDWIDENTGQYSEDAPIVPIIETELTGYNALYNGVEAFIEVVRLEDGTFSHIVAHLIDGTGTIIDPATATLVTPKVIPAELDLVLDEWLPICKNGVQYFRQLQYIVDNNTGLVQSTTAVWKDKTDAIIPSITAPFEIGYCADVAIQENAGIERWIRLDDATPTQAITTAQINDRLYDSLSISNLTPYADLGDFRPFRGQNPQNTTVVWVEVTFFDPLTASNYNAWYSIPSGSKLIQMEGKSIVEVTRIAVQDKIDADLSANGNNLEIKAFSNGSAPSTPVNLLFTFNLSV